MTEVRTRFAPSPTGTLHIGGARTALFSWLYARQYQGKFILRIEDTDLERSTQSSIEAILNSMEWLQLDYDEGPFYQTQRFDCYRAAVQNLIDRGHAYRCTCSKERLAALRESQLARKIKPRYDGHCRDKQIQSADTFVVRFRNPEQGMVTFTDLLRGEISVSNTELDDLIIARSDGVPTYNLTVVVDDWDMKISHVIRGDDHINNTPRQINILKALNANIPQYAHVPMILGADGKRLSKRHAAVGVLEYRDDGFLPQALLNYLVRLGWSHGNQEIFSRQEMITFFGLDKVSHSPAAFDPEKLLWINQHYLKSEPPRGLAPLLADQFRALGCDYRDGPSLQAVIDLQVDRYKTLREMAIHSEYFYKAVTEYDQKAVKKFFKVELIAPLRAVQRQLSELETWNKDRISSVIKSVASEFDLKLGKLAQPIRIAVTGGVVSPSIDSTLHLLGRKRVLKRLIQAENYLKINHKV